jgi:hypothetical protein
MLTLSDARRAELVERAATLVSRWNLRQPAILLLAMHAPVAFLGSQFLLAAQPFLGVFTGHAFARDFALLFQDPNSIEQLLERLERQPGPPSGSRPFPS